MGYIILIIFTLGPIYAVVPLEPFLSQSVSLFLKVDGVTGALAARRSPGGRETQREPRKLAAQQASSNPIRPLRPPW
jgi:hypothetical protein